MKATVYFIDMSEADRCILNARTWDSEVGAAYLRAKDGLIDSNNVHMVRKAADLYAKDSEHLWSKLQNGRSWWGSWRNDPNIECHIGFSARSMDIGDLVVWEDGRIERVTAIGFETITPTQILRLRLGWDSV